MFIIVLASKKFNTLFFVSKTFWIMNCRFGWCYGFFAGYVNCMPKVFINTKNRTVCFPSKILKTNQFYFFYPRLCGMQYPSYENPSSSLVPAYGCYILYSFIQKYLINCLYIIIRCTLSDHIIDLFD